MVSIFSNSNDPWSFGKQQVKPKVSPESIARFKIYAEYNQYLNTFTKDYSSKTLFQRVSIRVKSLFTETVFTKFNAAERKCAQAYAATYKGHLLSLESELKHPINKDSTFLKQAMEIAKENIRNDKSGKGFLYQIKNAKGEVVGHLIGTIHCTSKINKNITITPKMQEALQKCQKLITEVGESLAVHILASSIATTSIDFKIIRYAKKFNKKTDQFETILDQIKLSIKTYSETIKALSLTLGELFASIKRDDILSYHITEEWKEGNEASMIQLAYQQPKYLLADRNDKWLQGTAKKKGLIQQFKEADQQNQICVAVGTGHLFANFGLIEELKKQGFKIERILD